MYVMCKRNSNTGTKLHVIRREVNINNSLIATNHFIRLSLQCPSHHNLTEVIQTSVNVKLCWVKRKKKRKRKKPWKVASHYSVWVIMNTVWHFNKIRIRLLNSVWKRWFLLTIGKSKFDCPNNIIPVIQYM